MQVSATLISIKKKGIGVNNNTLKFQGHEIAGVIKAIGKNVTKFKVGDRAGVGCMVDGCTTCENEEQYTQGTLFTYGYPDEREPTGISQGGYATNIVVKRSFCRTYSR